MPPYTYITKQHQLDLAISQLQSAPRISVDTESSGFYTYKSDLCLIQISAGPYHFIIDTLQDLRLNRLGELFASDKHIKIFHAAASDILEMRKACQFDFENIFDTFIACRMLARSSCSLAGLAKDILGIEMEKTEQKSNWKKRPLTSSQLEYAHLDTAYLERIMDHLKEELENRNLLEEFFEEVDWTIHMEHQEEKQSDGYEWLKVSGAHYLDPDAKGRLRVLYELRDQIAKKNNLALFRVLPNKSLLDFASRPPETIDEIKERRLLQPRFVEKEGERFLETLQYSQSIPDHELPPRKPFDPDVEELFVKLKKWRTSIAEKRKIDTTVILSNRVLKILAEQKPQDQNAIKQLAIMPEGKIERYGAQIIDVLKNSQKK